MKPVNTRNPPLNFPRNSCFWLYAFCPAVKRHAGAKHFPPPTKSCQSLVTGNAPPPRPAHQVRSRKGVRQSEKSLDRNEVKDIESCR